MFNKGFLNKDKKGTDYKGKRQIHLMSLNIKASIHQNQINAPNTPLKSKKATRLGEDIYNQG